MGLTAFPDPDGTMEISRGGEPVTLTRDDIEGSESFDRSEKRFLLELLDSAASGGTCTACRPGA